MILIDIPRNKFTKFWGPHIKSNKTFKKANRKMLKKKKFRLAKENWWTFWRKTKAHYAISKMIIFVNMKSMKINLLLKLHLELHRNSSMMKKLVSHRDFIKVWFLRCSRVNSKLVVLIILKITIWCCAELFVLFSNLHLIIKVISKLQYYNGYVQMTLISRLKSKLS